MQRRNLPQSGIFSKQQELQTLGAPKRAAIATRITSSRNEIMPPWRLHCTRSPFFSMQVRFDPRTATIATFVLLCGFLAADIALGGHPNPVGIDTAHAGIITSYSSSTDSLIDSAISSIIYGSSSSFAFVPVSSISSSSSAYSLNSSFADFSSEIFGTSSSSLSGGFTSLPTSYSSSSSQISVPYPLP